MTEPDWKLLPHQPVQFFELPEDYDRRDLKRAYGRLIKVYRPEQQPEEFRKIRDAFEQLESWLSYRDLDTSAEITPLDINIPVDLSEDHLSGSFSSETQEPSKPAVRPSLKEILETHTPEEWFLQLTAKAEKDPTDYIHLAIVSEVIEGQPEQSFLNWLCVGLKTYPHNTNLHRFVNQYCRQVETREQSAEVLNLLCLTLPPAKRLALTEPLWDDLLKTDFVTFQRLWEDHLLPYRDYFPEQFVPFLSAWLIPAVWTSSPQWLDDQVQYLESHADLINHHLEFSFEFYELLKNYLNSINELDIEHNEEFPYLQFHKNLRALCLADGEKEMETYWEFQRELSQTFSEWSPKFQSQKKQSSLQQQLAIVWEWSAHYAKQQRQRYVQQLDTDQATICSREWIRSLIGSLVPQVVSQLSYAGWMFLQLIICMTGLFLFNMDEDSFLFTLLIILGMISALFLSWGLQNHIEQTLTNYRYRHKVRPQALQFLQEKRPTFWQIHRAFDGWLDEENPRVTDFQVYYGTLLLKDPALRIYRTALDFE
ncbi:hypothetical protein [Rubinisphaera italica]|uniref:J domain-containing protein n=1 Tax=Rubinisphaera italica TaxID=2527969 RepID=A0A5C5XDL7_9PLAN|nr:hypothetical protein [Rubinisphaera italica]TWT60012.1 hypothetical protein Pan54_07240 [Rubinisphaera italica]